MSEMTPYFTITKCNKLFITYLTSSTERLPSLPPSISTIGEKTKTGDSYQTAQETDEERKTSLEKMVATELLKLTMETVEERKERLKKMVANHSAEVSP